MIRSRVKAVAFTLLLTTSALSAWAFGKDQAPELAEVMAGLSRTYSSLADLSADFTQTVRFKDFDMPFTSKGKLYLKKSGKMRWDYREPSTQQIYVNENRVIYYVPEHRQAIRSLLSTEGDAHLPLHLLVGAAALEKEFEIRFETAPKEGAPVRLHLVPHDPHFKDLGIVVTVQPSAYTIREVQISEPNGNVSTFRFDNLRLNAGLPDDLFSFSPPKGIDLLDAPLPPPVE